ncbi:MAG: hypothetical protein PHQ28_05010 [Mycobacterium sp.]|nr:hypothetical protein [Mycobacterium sp.]
MAIPVLFTVELFPYIQLNGNIFEDSVREFNDELREYFADKVELHDIPRDSTNLTEVTTVYGTNTEEVPFVSATVVIGFKGDISLEQARALAAQFETTKFNHVSAEVKDPADYVKNDADADKVEAS